MNDAADRVVVVLDASVLYPFRVRDALPRFAKAGLYQARWSRHILGEWTGSLIRNKPHLEASVRSQERAMAAAFPEAEVEGYEDLITTLTLPDPNDRHVLAAAIRAGAQHIITENIRDFPMEAVRPFDISAVYADQFLSSTFELYPRQAMAAFRRMRRSYRAPAMSPDGFITDLVRAGLPLTAMQVRVDIDAL